MVGFARFLALYPCKNAGDDATLVADHQHRRLCCRQSCWQSMLPFTPFRAVASAFISASSTQGETWGKETT